MINHPLPPKKESFIEQVTEKLGAVPLDFSEKFRMVGEAEDSHPPLLAAGVLLLLSFREKDSPAREGEGEFVFRLIKRSNHVSQGGDLSCPGGILHPRWDSLIMRIITSGAIPLLRNKAGIYARQRDDPTFRAIALFLANAVRESWEEIRLNPYRIVFLGPLPSCSLELLPRIIFPLVCHVDMSHRLHTNYEVEYLVDIPVDVFFQKENYGMLIREVDRNICLAEEGQSTLPCLIYPDGEGRENILWGATFHIIVNFLRTVFDFQLPEWQKGRLIHKAIGLSYLSGDHNKI